MAKTIEGKLAGLFALALMGIGEYIALGEFFKHVNRLPSIGAAISIVILVPAILFIALGIMAVFMYTVSDI